MRSASVAGKSSVRDRRLVMNIVGVGRGRWCWSWLSDDFCHRFKEKNSLFTWHFGVTEKTPSPSWVVKERIKENVAPTTQMN